jgi:hypothetical protein
VVCTEKITVVIVVVHACHDFGGQIWLKRVCYVAISASNSLEETTRLLWGQCLIMVKVSTRLPTSWHGS